MNIATKPQFTFVSTRPQFTCQARSSVKSASVSVPGFPSGYFRLTLGTEYIVIANMAVPVEGLAGEHIGDAFYPTGYQLDEGFLIRTREATVPEKADTLAMGRAQMPTDAPTYDITQDWK